MKPRGPGIRFGRASLAQSPREGHIQPHATVITSNLSQALRYPALHRAQWQSRDSLDAIQWRRFQKILRIAYAESPFYRETFDGAGITPDVIRSRKDLEQIPITTREDLRNPERLVCTGRSVEELHCSLTTGSTGRRTRSYFDDRAWFLAKHLLKLRARLTTGVSPTDRIALLQESEAADQGPGLRERLFRLKSFSIDQSVTALLDELRAFKPTVLYGFPSHLQRLANEVEGHLRISRVYTSGEFLVGTTRKLLEAAFDAPVLDVYGCTEVKEIAWQCLEQDGYHINSDWLLVEVPTHDPKRSSEGPILVTALYNQAMPLIRYEVGDTGTLLHEPCNCGRGLPLMRPTGGRTVDYFEIPDGSTVSPYAMTYSMEQVKGVRQFKIVQTSTDRVTVNAVTESGREQTIATEIRSNLGKLLPGVAIEVQVVEGIEPDSHGKFRVVHSHVNQAE